MIEHQYSHAMGNAGLSLPEFLSAPIISNRVRQIIVTYGYLYVYTAPKQVDIVRASYNNELTPISFSIFLTKWSENRALLLLIDEFDDILTWMGGVLGSPVRVCVAFGKGSRFGFVYPSDEVLGEPPPLGETEAVVAGAR
jgi:hypothetical protein